MLDVGGKKPDPQLVADAIVKAALGNGLTREQIREIILQVAVYCGVPAGIDSTRIAREAFAEVDAANAAKQG